MEADSLLFSRCFSRCNSDRLKPSESFHMEKRSNNNNNNNNDNNNNNNNNNNSDNKKHGPSHNLLLRS